MTTLAVLIDEVLYDLDGDTRPLRGAAASMSTGSTLLTMTAGGTSVRPGDYLEIDDELVYVVSEDATDTSFIVSRGERGTIDTSHAEGARVWINPRHTRRRALVAAQDELQALPADLVAFTTVDVSLPASTGAVELPGVSSNVTVLAVVDAVREPRAAETHHPRVAMRLVKDPDGDQFASRWGVQLDDGWTYGSAQTVAVTYAHTFDLSTITMATDLTAIGFTVGLEVAFKYGLAWRLYAVAEASRMVMSRAGQLRDDEAVPPLYQAQVANAMKDQRDQAYNEERVRQSMLWPRRC